MKELAKSLGKASVFAACVLASGLLLAGCDEYVQIERNRDIPILQHQTWTWRPAGARREAVREPARDERPVVSRAPSGASPCSRCLRQRIQ